jgi:hypothetical protein
MQQFDRAVRADLGRHNVKPYRARGFDRAGNVSLTKCGDRSGHG